MFAHKNLVTGEKLDKTRHEDYESVNTSVAEYFRKYAVGKSDKMPTDPRIPIEDNRSNDEKIDDDSMINHLSCDDLDALSEMERNREKFEHALKDIELTQKQSEIFQNAVAVLDNPNSTPEQRREAYLDLEEIHDKVTRARKT